MQSSCTLALVWGHMHWREADGIWQPKGHGSWRADCDRRLYFLFTCRPQRDGVARSSITTRTGCLNLFWA